MNAIHLTYDIFCIQKAVYFLEIRISESMVGLFAGNGRNITDVTCWPPVTDVTKVVMDLQMYGIKMSEIIRTLRKK